MRSYPMVGGIDVAGTVVSSESERFSPGDEVLVTGAGLSETRDGGYAEYLRLDSNWVIPLPDGLSALEAMTIGTAGFTAALSLYRMEINGQRPEQGPIVVTGASGGVGSIAIDILAHAGYEVHAISGKEEQFGWLAALGAEECISRHELEWGQRPLESARWAGCIDSVGGDTLSGICAAIKPWGNIAACGLAGGIGLNTTVMPFIIRGVSLHRYRFAAVPLPDPRANLAETRRRMEAAQPGGDPQPRRRAGRSERYFRWYAGGQFPGQNCGGTVAPGIVRDRDCRGV